MSDMNIDLDDNTLSSTEEFGSGTMGDDTTGTLSSSHSPFSSGFDVEHPFPTYEELRNAGFSDHLARSISEGGVHSYSDKELFHVIYESEDPVAAYNEMMEAKARHAMDKADELINDIENSGLLGSSSELPDDNGTSHYNKPITLDTLKDDQKLGSCDCRSECNYNTGKRYMYADYGYSD